MGTFLLSTCQAFRVVGDRQFGTVETDEFHFKIGVFRICIDYLEFFLPNLAHFRHLLLFGRMHSKLDLPVRPMIISNVFSSDFQVDFQLLAMSVAVQSAMMRVVFLFLDNFGAINKVAEA